MPTRRPERLSGLLLHAVAEILLREVKDPRVRGVTLTGVTVSSDLRTATVFFRTLRVEEQPAAQAGLQSATGYIRHQIAGRLRLRHIPTLSFRYDATLDKATRLESLLRQAKEMSSGREEEP